MRIGLLKTLKHFAEQPGRNSKERAEAKGLLLQLKTLKVCFILEFLDLIFPIVNCASKYMQGTVSWHCNCDRSCFLDNCGHG
jgi:hypothetical protein